MAILMASTLLRVLCIFAFLPALYRSRHFPVFVVLFSLKTHDPQFSRSLRLVTVHSANPPTG